MQTANKIFIQIILLIVLMNAGIYTAEARDGFQGMPRLAKKEIPQINFTNLSPPYKDYDYFQGYDEYPFREHANSFDLINAWWLAEASTLV